MSTEAKNHPGNGDQPGEGVSARSRQDWPEEQQATSRRVPRLATLGVVGAVVLFVVGFAAVDRFDSSDELSVQATSVGGLVQFRDGSAAPLEQGAVLSKGAFIGCAAAGMVAVNEVVLPCNAKFGLFVNEEGLLVQADVPDSTDGSDVPVLGRRLNFRGADFAESDLDGSYFRSADFEGANLRRASLIRAHFGDTNLAGADLSNADLTLAILGRANLTGANLTGANLTGANLTGANLTGANITGANLAGANLTGANLDQVCWLLDADPVWPDETIEIPTSDTWCR